MSLEFSPLNSKNEPPESSAASGEAESQPVRKSAPEALSQDEPEMTQEMSSSAIEERGSARAFSKEHSQFYRDRLARDIRGKLNFLKEFLKRQSSEIQKLEEQKQGRLDYVSSRLESLEAEHAQRSEYAKEFDEFRSEVETLENEIEEIKSSFWKRLLAKDRLAELEARKGAFKTRSEEMHEPDREKMAQLYMEIAKQKAYLASEEADDRTQRRIAEIKEHGFFVQDSTITESRDLIKEFYQKNLEIMREGEESPLARDVAENSRTHGVLLRHGVPDPHQEAFFAPDWSGNNPMVNTQDLDSGKRLKFAAAIEPAISTHSVKTRRSGHMEQGFIVGGGEITAASENDLFSYASSLDQRNPKYDEASVSSLQANISENFAKAIQQGGQNEQRPWNEIIVRHPKFSAVYVQDRGDYGQYTEDGYNKFYQRAKWALEQAKELGMPAVVILDSGKIINIATDQEMTQEDLLSNPVSYSPDEREQIFKAAAPDTAATDTDGSGASFIEQRIASTTQDHTTDQDMELFKRLNNQQAEGKLAELESERQANVQRLKNELGINN